MPYEGETDFDSGDYHATLERCLAEIGWAEKKALQGKLVEGAGTASPPAVSSKSGGCGPKENARLAIETDGTVTIYVGSSVLGQGLETALAQIAADALELPFERVAHLPRLDHLSARRASAPLRRAPW